MFGHIQLWLGLFEVHSYSSIQFSRLVTLERKNEMPVLAHEKTQPTNSTLLVIRAGHKGVPPG